MTPLQSLLQFEAIYRFAITSSIMITPTEVTVAQVMLTPLTSFVQKEIQVKRHVGCRGCRGFSL